MPPAGGPQGPDPVHTDHYDGTSNQGATTMYAPPMQAPVAKKPSGLAVAALVVGICAFLSGLLPVFGALVGVVAVVLGVLALRKHQPKGMSVTGLVLGGVAVIASIGMTAGLGALMSSPSSGGSVASVTRSAEPTDEATSMPPEPEETPEAEAAAAEPVEEAPAAAPAPQAPSVSTEFASALVKAEMYSETMYMSKQGLYDQLTSEYGEQFSAEAAQYAVDTIQADWNANAAEKAKMYQDTMAMSPAAIRDQLTSEYGEKFTAEQADYGVAHMND